MELMIWREGIREKKQKLLLVLEKKRLSGFDLV